MSRIQSPAIALPRWVRLTLEAGACAAFIVGVCIAVVVLS
jgi:hypothetical protein